MPQTCAPVLIPWHPVPRSTAEYHHLPAFSATFADFRTANPGMVVGFKLTVIHRDHAICPLSPGSFLISQGPEQEFDEMCARDALRDPRMLDAMELLLHTPSILQDTDKNRWEDYGWQSSSDKFGFHLRELWIFSHTALLMNNVHSCYVDDIKDLADQAMVLHEEPASNHAALSLAGYINDLLRCVSPASIPDLVEEWPEGVPQGSIPFSKVDPEQLFTL